MFIPSVGAPTKIKKVIYLITWIILGLLLSLIAHAGVEMGYLSWAETQKHYVVFYGGCALPYIVQIIIWLLGIIGGYFSGRFWWRKIYIERFWEKNMKEK